jgi:Zn-dependent protease
MSGILSQFATNPILTLIDISVIVAVITVHEFAHAKTADSLGDPTPRLEGRVTLDPRAHLDFWGSLMIVLVGFGWGRAVRFDPFNLKDVRKDTLKIALAGPVSNIIMALCASLIYKLLLFQVPDINLYISEFFKIFIVMNVYLAVFNMLPIEPLDGFKVVWGLLPEDQAQKWQTLAPYGFILLIFLVFFPPAPGIQIVTAVSRTILGLLL